MSTEVTKRQSINPPATRALYDALHFSQATRVGNTVWVSGQVGIDAAMKPAEGMEAQAHLAFRGLRSVLEAAGASLGDVVELTTFHTDLRGEMQDRQGLVVFRRIENRPAHACPVARAFAFCAAVQLRPRHGVRH